MAEQLSAQDASFLYWESERVANHVGGLYIYDQSTAPNGLVTFKQILRHLEARLHLVPRYRQKLRHVMAKLDHPYWVDDEAFDIEYHVQHMALPKPGDWRQLCIMTSRIYDRPLDMSRPLWTFYIIEGLDHVEGLPKGSFAVVTKTHHALIDGVSGTAMATAIHDTKADAEAPPPVPWQPARSPTDIELLSRAYLRNLSQPLRMMDLLSEVVPATRRLMNGLSSDRFSWPKISGEVPRTRFNGSASGHRMIALCVVALADLRMIKSVLPGATINDVLLAMCGGALRLYLSAKNELPPQVLTALAPIAVRSTEQRDPSPTSIPATGGNQVTGMIVSLATDIADPLERLQAVHDSAASSKELTNAIGAKLMTDITKFVPSVTMGLASRLVSGLGLRTKLHPMVNTVVTNVPGPQVPLYFCGAQMVNQFSLGIVMDGLTLFHGVLSYNGKLSIAAMSDRLAMPDPAFYQDCLYQAFRELKDAASARLAPAPPKAKPAARRRASARA